MSEPLPIGRREDQHLEFKAAAVLDDPFKVGREVVAMLNAGSGDVWIGIEEKEGVGITVQDVRGAEARAERLREHLVDTIHPRPDVREVRVEVVEHPGGHCLVIRVDPKEERQPYSQVKKGGQFYWKRISAVIRPMSPAEVLQHSRVQDARDHSDEIPAMQQQLADERFRGFWIGIVPQVALEIRTTRVELEERIHDPSRMRLRFPGWNSVGPWSQVESAQGEPGGWNIHQDDAIRVFLRRDGVMELRVQSSALEHGTRGTINPFALAEFTQTLFKFAASIYAEADAHAPSVEVSAGIFGAADLPLRPFSPGRHGFDKEYPRHPHRHFEGGRDLLLEKPLVFEWNEMVSRPEACSYRLLLRVYQIHGYEEGEMPAELDRRTGELKI